MASVAQVRANRLNAQKSTGPRTAEGKAAVAQNAVKHGLLAQQVVIRGEDPGEFELFRDRMVQDLDPAGSLESLLAERVAHLGWRLRRAERIEQAAYTTLETDYAAREASRPPSLRRPQGEAQDEEETVLARVVVEDFGDARLLDRLLGYERRIENSLYRTVGELGKYRRLRGSELAVEPASPAVSGVPRSVKCEVSSVKQEGRSPGSELQTSNCTLQTPSIAPYGVTTNGSESDEEARQTNPIDAGSPDDQASPTAVEKLRRGRPSYEEASRDATANEERPDGVTTNGTSAAATPHHSNTLSFPPSGPLPANPPRETKPISAGVNPLMDPAKLSGASRAKWEALRKREIHAARALGLPASPVARQTPQETPDGVTTNAGVAGPFCQTKPIDRRE